MILGCVWIFEVFVQLVSVVLDEFLMWNFDVMC